MSYQKTTRVESPIKGKFYSMLRQDNQKQNDLLYKKSHTIKRKPIFSDSVQKSRLSSVSPTRRKIFSNKQQSTINNQQGHFSKVTQSQFIEQKLNDRQEQISSSNQSSDSISSSSIESNEGLQQIRKKLFPSTPIKKIAHDFEGLEEDRQFLTNSWKKLHFIESDQPLKSQFLLNSDGIQKTVLKLNFDTPVKSEDQTIYNKKINETTQKLFSNFNINIKDPTDKQGAVKTQKNETLNKPKSDLASKLRELHEKLSAQSRTCVKINSFTQCLRKQNEFLRKQNQRLQQKFIQFQRDTNKK